MKKNTNIVLVVLLITSYVGHTQSFINLNFEDATIVSDPSSGPFHVFANTAILGWTAYISGVAQTDIIYNAVPLSDPAVTLQGTGSGYPPIEGAYFAMLWGQFNPSGNSNASETNSAAIGQTGQIPFSAKSLTFWGTIGGMQATFNGLPIDFIVTGSTANYTIYSADISAYAGQTGQLLLTDP